MLDFLDMIGNCESRKVAWYEKINLKVDTCAVNDSDKPFETAISHPQYNDGDWIIVELYDTKEEAIAGHNKWVKTMTADELPKILKDVSSATIAKCYDIFDKDWRSMEKKEVKLKTHS